MGLVTCGVMFSVRVKTFEFGVRVYLAIAHRTNAKREIWKG